MLTKILLTALVILGCYLFIRYKRSVVQQQGAATPIAEDTLSANPLVRWFSVALLILSLTAAVGFFIYDWNDSRTLLEVQVISPHSGDKVVYQVYKGDLKERSFTTIQGQQVRIASNERLVVAESR